MKKEYKAPQLSIVNVMVEGLMQVPASQQQDNDWIQSKKNGRGFVDDEEEAPAAPKKFWDDEE
jgi:hypothetical protein